MHCAAGDEQLPDADPIALALARLPGHATPWRLVERASTPDGAPRWVYQSSPAPGDVMVVSTCASAHQDVRALEVPGVGILSRWKMADDADLPTLRMFLRLHPDARVLRYRPGVRATFATSDAIATVFPDDGCAALAAVHRLLAAAHVPRLVVPLPLRHDTRTLAFWQSRVRGEPLAACLGGILSVADATPWMDRVAEALAALHRSDIRFPHGNDLTDQQRRTMRNLPRSQPPDAVHTALDALCETLDRRYRALRADEDARTARPVHGSPHLGQWRVAGHQLGLVDFEHAGMGHPELDLASVITDLERRHAVAATELTTGLLARYRAAGGQVLQSRLSFYRAHQHLAAALAALRDAQAPRVRGHADDREQRTGEALRSITRANELLTSPAEVAIDEPRDSVATLAHAAPHHSPVRIATRDRAPRVRAVASVIAEDDRTLRT